jgi:hypothetical protein
MRYRAIHLSRDGRYLALNSWDGRTKIAYGPWDRSHYPVPVAREIFTDIYDAQTGASVFTVSAHVRGSVNFDSLFSLSTWVSSRYFVFPLDSDRLNRFVICDVERVSTEKQTNWKTLKLDDKNRK